MEYLKELKDILGEDLFFKIPDYQRGYSWEEGNWKDLIEDLEYMGISQEHYTGTIILHLDNNSSWEDDEGKIFDGEYNIVDGQQRLTSISLVLEVMAEEFDKLGKSERAKTIRKDYLYREFNGKCKTKIKLNQGTNEFYENLITLKSNIKGSSNIYEKRLSDAFDYFKKYFNNKRLQIEDNNEYYIWLDKLYKKVRTLIKFTVYKVKNEADVGLIFELMNNRGKSLTEMEKVKNYFLYITSKMNCYGKDDLINTINKKWESILNELMKASITKTESEDRMLRNHWIVYQDYDLRNWYGYDSIKREYGLKKHYNNNEELRDKIRDFVENMESNCVAFCDILHPTRTSAFNNISEEHKKENIIELILKLIRMGNVSTLLPLLIAARPNATKHNQDWDFYLELLDLCERYSFRVYFIMGKRSHTGRSSLYKLAYEIYHGYKNKQDCLNELRSYILYYSPNNTFEEIIDRVAEDSNWYEWNGIKYLLYEYELSLAKEKERVHITWNNLKDKSKATTTEHILPVTPNKEYWQNRWSDEEMLKALNDIGNLVLTLDNSAYQNKGFDEKKGSLKASKKCYANSPLFMERELAKYDEWTWDEFMERRNNITSWIKQRWKIDEQEIEDIIPEEEEEEPDEIAEVSPELY